MDAILLISLGATASIALAALAVRAAWATSDAPSALTEAPSAPSAASAPSVVRSAQADGWLSRVSAPWGTPDRSRDALQLAQAGLQGPRAMAVYDGARVLLAAGALVAVLVGWGGAGPFAWFGAVAAALVAFELPWAVVALLARARRSRIQASVPDMIDLLVSCVEAGLGIDGAFRQVAQELAVSSPELARELAKANAEMTAGLSRSDALTRLDSRLGVEEITALVGVLGQAERFGAGVGPSLRAHAQLSRRRRALNAEQRAARASPLLTVVMILFILPALFVVLLGPTVVAVVQRFLPTLGVA
jgi:tight adherence protein C